MKNLKTLDTLKTLEILEQTCRKLFLRNYVLPINIGVYDFEKKAAQRVIINVDLYVLLAKTTPTSDHLDEVLNYEFIRETIKTVVTGRHIHLQETLCDELMAAFMLSPWVQAARISSAKPEVYPDCDAVGVEVFKIKNNIF